MGLFTRRPRKGKLRCRMKRGAWSKPGGLGNGFRAKYGPASWHDRAIRFAREELVDDLLGRDERREFWREGWRRCARFGILGLPVPETFGGQGQGLPVTIGAMEGLGYGCPDNGLIFAMNASMWTVTIPILVYGSEAQKRQILPGLCDGSTVGANGASEIEAGSDIFSMKTRAERRGRNLGAQRSKNLGNLGTRRRPVRLLRIDRPDQRGSWDLRLHYPEGRAGISSGKGDSQARRPHRTDGGVGTRGLHNPGGEPSRQRGSRGGDIQLLDGMGARGDSRVCPGDDEASSNAVSNTPGPESSLASE